MSDDAAGAPARYLLELAYDGSGFSGWARQPGLRTVQGVLEEALEALFRRTGSVPRLTVAGRTDAGVHAAAQVAHLDLAAAQERALSSQRAVAALETAEALAYRLNGVLGPSSDVVVHRARRAPSGFDARFSAVWRRYEYLVSDRHDTRDPLQRHRMLWHPAELDVEAMDAAAAALLGLHDFAAFCKPREGATTIRTLQEFTWSRRSDGVIAARVRADAFCHSMVRALVGASIAVGQSRLSADRLPQLLAEARRSSEFAVVPAHGLTLCEVGYPDDAQLAARAEQTRARREGPGERPAAR